MQTNTNNVNKTWVLILEFWSINFVLSNILSVYITGNFIFYKW
jgi:hypothetical protein